MRIYYIVLFIYAFTLGISIMDAMGIFYTKYSIATPEVPQPEEISTFNPSSLDPVTVVIAAFNLALKVLYNATIGFLPMMLHLGVPFVLASAIASMVYISYAAGIFMILRGISME